MAAEKTKEEIKKEKQAAKKAKKEERARGALPSSLISADTSALKSALFIEIDALEALKKQLNEKRKEVEAIKNTLFATGESCGHENVTKQNERKYKCNDCGEILRIRN